MLSEDCTKKFCLFVKLNLATILFLVAILLPYLAYLSYGKNAILLNNFNQRVSIGTENQQNQIDFNSFLTILTQNKFSGQWLSSIKQSKLLSSENGTIELVAKEKASDKYINQYEINIKIFDGTYQDNGYYQIQLQSSSIKTQQQFISNHLIYETTSPAIGLRKYNRVFVTQKEKPIFINKLKFRLKYQQTLKIQLLLAAEYEINIVTQSLEKSWDTFQQIILSLVVLLQVGIQAYGAFFLMLQASQQKLIANSISPTFLKLGYYFDLVQLIILVFYAYQENLKILPFSLYFLLIHIIYIEWILYQQVTGKDGQTVFRTFRSSSNQSLQSSEQQSSGPFIKNKGLQYLFATLQQYQDILACTISYFIFYMNNMEDFIYVIFFLIYLVPQLARNCRSGNKINYSFQLVLANALPKLIPLLYVRLLGVNTIFMLEPHYWFSFACILFMVIYSCVLFIQKKHGARAILPKFLIPKGMKTKFKFFMILDENVNCLVCRSELSSLPSQLKQKNKLNQQIVYNKVVLTPCHHKFHAICLDKWMQNRVQCPSCDYTLPPIEHS